MVNEIKELSNRQRIAFTGVKVGQWANARNIVKGSNVKSQFVKLVEENGETFEAVEDCNLESFKDAVGDSTVVNTILLLQMGKNPNEYIREPDVKYVKVARDFRSSLFERNTLMTIIKLGRIQGDMAAMVARSKFDKLPDTIKEFTDCMHHLCHLLGICFAECFEIAYSEIEHRKGSMINDVYVKEDDI
jgi:hypothetical protein